MKRKIAYISEYYSEGMGYTENCLPRALKKLGYDIRVITSNLQVYAFDRDYNKIYYSYLGPNQVTPGVYKEKGITIYREKHNRISSYVDIPSIGRTLKRFKPDIVQIGSPVSILGMRIISMPTKFKAFTECHQHISVAAHLDGLRRDASMWPALLWYRLTRTLPGYLESMRVRYCFAISPDCKQVAETHYGYPPNKVVYIPLGTDTEVFHPPKSTPEFIKRKRVRTELGVSEDEFLIIYTGKFTRAKNPLLLARAIEKIIESGIKVKGLFIGDGEQKLLIEEAKGCIVLPFMRHELLSDYYRSCELAAWPFQESMSMLDALSSGLPILVSDKMGDLNRVQGVGFTYEEGNLESLVYMIRHIIRNIDSQEVSRKAYSYALGKFSWDKVAKQYASYYES